MNKITVILVALSFNLSAQTTYDYIDNDWPDSRYIDHGDGTVTDTATSLMWMRCTYSSTGIAYDAASNTCNGDISDHGWGAAMMAVDPTVSFNYANYGDWRLPNAKELASLVAFNSYDPAINATIFPGVISDEYWTASPAPTGRNYALAIDFTNGYSTSSQRHNKLNILLVRDLD